MSVRIAGRRRTWLVGLVALWPIGGGPGPGPRPSSVLLITLDTTRADRLPAYGFTGVEMPALDRLAREGVVFDDAMTVAPLTLPAHSSLFTGRIPPAHGVRENADALGADIPVLAELLRRRGYRTAAFVGSAVLDADRGLGRGFDLYQGVDEPTAASGPRRFQRPADEVVDVALAWLRHHAGSRFFAWVHLYDAHAPYAPPEPYRTRHAGDLYSGELAFADSQIARLLAFLDDRAPDTAIVVAADHGESLGDHGERGHGIFVYQSTLRVPLVVRWPGIRPRRVAGVVRLIDLAPTVLDLERIPQPAMDGQSLVPVMTAAGHRDLPAYAESMYPRRFGWSELRALRAGRFKLIAAPRPELYDLQADPGEQHNVYATRPQTVRAMLARLKAFDDIRHADPGDAVAVRERLASLGYVARSGETGLRQAATTKPDPKDVIAQYNAITEARLRVHAR
jgi:arylsulfatase A-like enzyme